MYARVTLAQIQPGKAGELIQFLVDNVVAAAQQQQGFKGLLVLTDESSNKGIAITLWETNADMAAGEASSLPDTFSKETVKFLRQDLKAPALEA